MASKKKKAKKSAKKKGAKKATKKKSTKKSAKKSVKKPVRKKAPRKRSATKKAARKRATKKRAPSKKKPRRSPAAPRSARGKRAKKEVRGSSFFEHFRRRLLAEREQIARRVDELREELRGLEETPREMEEWAQEEKDRDILIRLEERETEELRKIQAALTLIDTREYGKCQVCGKPIPRARLEELPTAFRCVDCTP